MGLFKKKHRHRHISPLNSENKKTLHKNLEFTATEQYKLIRANLDFTLPVDQKCPVIGVTSSMRGEGKSTTAVNLSYVFAEKGSKVLLIDADLRKPTTHKYFGLPYKKGLSNYLAGQDTLEDCIQKVPDVENLYHMASGVIPPNPAELLAGKQMEVLFEKLDEMFDVIIVDTPPVNVVADALSICRFVDGVTIVASDNKTGYTELQDAVKQLKIANAKILGIVLNRARQSNYRSRQRYSNYYRTNEE